MNTNGAHYIGIDLTSQRKNFTCAVLDQSRHVLFCGTTPLSEWKSILEKYPHIIAGANFPMTLNRGLMADEMIRRQLGLSQKRIRFKEMRLCEYLLAKEGLTVSKTPRDVNQFSPSLQKSFKFTSQMGADGFQFWPAANAGRQMLESHADGAYWSLLGVLPFPASTFEGRIQRQLALQKIGVAVPDPMEFFEEITRHRLLTGKLPDEMIFTSTQLNALICADTAWAADQPASECAQIGDPEEGIIFLPTHPII